MPITQRERGESQESTYSARQPLPTARRRSAGDDSNTEVEGESAMPSTEWSAKRKRQYEHIRDGLLERGKSTDTAEQIAARTVNKERAQHGESVEASASSVNDLPPGRRGGLRSHTGAAGRTVAQLRNEARQRGVKGRAAMNKAQLEKALER